MKYNPDYTKQGQKVIFSKKIIKTEHPPLYFHQNFVKSGAARGSSREKLYEEFGFESL